MGLASFFRRAAPQTVNLAGDMERLVTGEGSFPRGMRGLRVGQQLQCELRPSPAAHEDWNSAQVYHGGRQIGWVNISSPPEYPLAVQCLADLEFRVLVPAEVVSVREEMAVRVFLAWPRDIIDMKEVPDSVKRILYQPQMDQDQVTLVGVSKLAPRISAILQGLERQRVPASLEVVAVSAGKHAGKPQIHVLVDGEPFGLVPHQYRDEVPDIFDYALAGNTAAEVEVRSYAKPWVRLHVQTRPPRY